MFCCETQESEGVLVQPAAAGQAAERVLPVVALPSVAVASMGQLSEIRSCTASSILGFDALGSADKSHEAGNMCPGCSPLPPGKACSQRCGVLDACSLLMLRNGP